MLWYYSDPTSSFLLRHQCGLGSITLAKRKNMRHVKVCLTAFVVMTLPACGGREDVAPVPMLAMDQSRHLAQAASVQSQSVEVFSGKLANYSIVSAADGFNVVDNATQAIRSIGSAKTLLFADYSVSLDLDGTAARIYRLYQAAFDRVPDLAGLGFHVASIDGVGVDFTTVAQGFIDSPEFRNKYGSTGNKDYVSLLYNNILHRAPDPGGLAFWTGALDAASVSRAQVLTGFSESAENANTVNERIKNGVVYAPYPVAGKGTASSARPEGSKFAWGVLNGLSLVLRDSRGVEVPGGHLTCTAGDASKLFVSGDCRTAVSHTLGEQTITVAGDGVTASLPLLVIPKRQPLGTGAGSGGDFNLVVTATGNLLAWGGNQSGVLGQGADILKLESSSLPLPVKNSQGNGTLENIVAASGGELNAGALTEDGKVLIWGSDYYFPSTGNPSLPNRMPNPAGTGDLSHIVQVAVGSRNAAALTDEGTVLSWGYYTGQGTASNIRYPNHVKDPTGTDILKGIVAISAGAQHTLALGSNGKVYGWGWYQSQRGNPAASETLPAVVKLASDNSELTNIVAISAGYSFALALSADGNVYAWGDDIEGQLGQNSRGGSYRGAVLVKDVSGSAPLSNIVMISAGGNHALALDSSGRVLSWGSSTSGQLGDGANRPIVNQSEKPIYVVGPDSTGKLDGIVAIGSGYNHSLALSKSGTVYIWGDGFRGNLGQGGTSTSDLWVPTPVKNTSGAGELNLAPLTAYFGLSFQPGM